MTLQCPVCLVMCETAAERFIHDKLHSETHEGLGRNATNLHALPFVLFKRVASLMEQYHQSMMGRCHTDETPEDVYG